MKVEECRRLKRWQGHGRHLYAALPPLLFGA